MIVLPLNKPLKRRILLVLLSFFSSSMINLLVLNSSSHVFGASLLYFDKSS